MNKYTEEEVAKHHTEESLWLVIDKKVYDVTKFINEHPGGKRPLLKEDRAGKDVSEKFKSIKKHMENVNVPKMLESMLIGEIY